MKLQSSSTTNIERPSTESGSEMRLRGRVLLIARVSWIVLTLFILTLNVVMVPRYDAVLQAHCQPGSLCVAFHLTTYDRQLLHQFGLSPGFLAGYQVILSVVTVVVNCALGALIFWRKSADRMAFFCASMLVLFGDVGTYPNILLSTLAPVSPVWFALIGTLSVLGQSGFIIFFFLFPSGRFVPRWTRWVALCVILYWIYTTFSTNIFYTASALSNLVFAAFLLCAVGAQVYRYRRVSTFRERQQTKWVVLGFSTGIVGFLLFLVLGNALLPPAILESSVMGTLIAGTVLDGFLLLIPISIAFAILRSQLWDIDILINKALVYGLLSGTLGVLYAGLIIGLESLVGLFASQKGQPVVIALSTLVIAALFQPLRRRIQELIDRRFYRRKYDAARTLDDFSATLRSELDLEQLSKHLVAVVQETMQPTSVSLWLRSPAHSGNHQVQWRANTSVPTADEDRNER